MMPHRAMHKQVSPQVKNGLDNGRKSPGKPSEHTTIRAPRPASEKGTTMRVYYDRDADLNLIKGRKVVIVGYGSQATPMR